MSGWTTASTPTLVTFNGSELTSFDTEQAQGQSPQTGAVSILQLANAISQLANGSSKTLVAGSRYFVSYNIGQPWLLNGVQVHVGTTGGTDKWLVELHDSNGVLVATSALAGVTVSTANSWQQFAFTTPYQAAPGNYFIAVQTNGTTALLDTYAAPALPLLTGSSTGTFGTSANITPPTTYTAALGPRVSVY